MDWIPAAFAWPIAVVVIALVLGALALFLFREPISRLLERTERVGKDGASFQTAQQSQKQSEPEKLDNAARLDYDGLMNRPVSTTVLGREQNIRREIGHLDQERQIRVLMRAASISLVGKDFYELAHRSFGSQVDLLVRISGTPPGIGLTLAEVEQIFDNAKANFPTIHENRTFQEWLKYPATVGLISVANERVDITALGSDFLKYLVDERLAYPRNG